MRYVLVVYDIPDDKKRLKVFNACKDQGLQHYQCSVFLGKLSRTRQKELSGKVEKVLGKSEGKVHIQPFWEEQLKDAWIRL